MIVNAFLIRSNGDKEEIQVNYKSNTIAKGVLVGPIVSYGTKLIENMPEFKGKRLSIIYERECIGQLNHLASEIIGHEIYGDAIISLKVVEFNFRINLSYDDLQMIIGYMIQYKTKKNRTKRIKS